MFKSYNVSGEYSLYIVSEACSEWTLKKLFAYICVFICCSKHDTTPRVHYCTTKLYKYVFAPSTSHSFCFKSLYLYLFLFPCSYPPSEPYHCWSCSLLPLPSLYSLLNHPAVINKHITHPQFLHIASSSVLYLF